MKRRFAPYALAAAFAAWTPAASEASELPKPLTSSELATIRAGYVSLDGVNFSFAVTLQTFVNGQLALSSTMALDSASGANFSAQGSPSASASGPFAASASLMNGNTTLLQDFTTNSIRNLVSTSASNQTIAQNANVTLALSGFQVNQAAYQQRSVVSNLTALLAAGRLAGR